MKNRIHTFSLIGLLALVVLLARALSARLNDLRPQAADVDVLQIVLGDARRVVSQAMLQRVDAYFHGGAQHDDCAGLHVHDHEEHDDAEDPQESHLAHHASTIGRMGDPWRWLNLRIHVQEHRHLADADFDELLPWVWAACQAAPDNIQAYQIGAYVLWRHTSDAAASIRLLKQGLAVNPANAELAFALGEYYLNRDDQPAVAETWFRQAAAHNALDSKATDDARLLKLRTLHYLGFLAQRRGDTAELQRVLAEAQAIQPKHAAVRALEALLANPGN